MCVVLVCEFWAAVCNMDASISSMKRGSETEAGLGPYLFGGQITESSVVCVSHRCVAFVVFLVEFHICASAQCWEHSCPFGFQTFSSSRWHKNFSFFNIKLVCGSCVSLSGQKTVMEVNNGSFSAVIPSRDAAFLNHHFSLKQAEKSQWNILNKTWFLLST